MKNVYLPYFIGSDGPIPNLFKGFLPHSSNNELYYTAFWQGKNPEYNVDNVHCVPAHSAGSLRRKIAWATTTLSDFDLIHTGGIVPMHYYTRILTAIRNPNIKHVHTFRIDVDPDSKFPTKYRKKLSEMADVTTAVSRSTARTVNEHFDINPHVIYNGVSADMFHPKHEMPEMIKQIGGYERSVFLFVGSLDPRKRPKDVIKVAERIPNAEFLIIGDGPLREELEQQAKKLENVNVVGRIPKVELPKIYANSTALLFPTTLEGCPNVVLEAMASGKPVLGYHATSMAELVQNGKTGYLSPIGDIESLVTNARRVMAEHDELGEEACQYIRNNHTFDIIGKKYEDIYLRAFI
ncbi:glycosyltransferase family 4 protein [Haloarcula sediminis]|uniref:glycosyltransferase family 4 protein n=1 Tax=Haloarcula sediminis TaxID=3111777 RepID=UPI002D78FDED|nr:glycosyltransferase family 4 protein [Haloarcula sp. CK38]